MLSTGSNRTNCKWGRAKTWGLSAAALLLAAPASAIGLDPFGTLGRGGLAQGQAFSAGLGTEIYEIDSYLNVAGEDLNGGADGTSGRLGADLIEGFEISFASSLSDSDTDITLTYSIERTGGEAGDVQFISYVDAQIDDFVNGFFNESAETSGTLAAGQAFEIDEPFFAGDILENVLSGDLDSTNSFAGEFSEEDVAMALSFDLGTLDTGDQAVIEIMLSEDGDGLGSWLMTQSDLDPSSPDRLSYSGRATVQEAQASLTEPASAPIPLAAEEASGSGSGSAPAVPEPSAALVFALGSLVVGRASRRRR